MTTQLRGLRLAVIDVETTGLDPSTDHIVEIAVAHVTLGSPKLPRLAGSWRVRPPIPISAAVTRIHGITDEDVAGCPTWAKVAPEVVMACDGRQVAAHHAVFDHLFVVAEEVRIGRATRLPWPWIDTKIPGMVLDRYVSGKSLGSLCARRGIVLDPHGAAGDAVAAALLFPLLMREGWTAIDRYSRPLMPKLRTLEELLAWQREAALAEEVDHCAYQRSQGMRGPRPPCRWHELYGVKPPAWEPMPATYTIDCDGKITRIGEP